MSFPISNHEDMLAYVTQRINIDTVLQQICANRPDWATGCLNRDFNVDNELGVCPSERGSYGTHIGIELPDVTEMFAEETSEEVDEVINCGLESMCANMCSSIEELLEKTGPTVPIHLYAYTSRGKYDPDTDSCEVELHLFFAYPKGQLVVDDDGEILCATADLTCVDAITVTV